MALQFQKQEISCLRNVLSQTQNLEQTQELRLPEGMPGVGQIPGCWGQVLIRSKEWNGDTVRLSGGVLVWLLYLPEGGGETETLESWIPFQTDFELPQACREGHIRVKSLLRLSDARPVSAGKILIRAGIGLQVQCWSPETAEVYQPEGTDEALEVLTQRWPLWISREMGEKTFELEEELILPASAPKPEKLMYYRMTADTADKKVLGNKLVFRGSARLHLLYSSADGQLYTWDFEVPFSQYAQLEDSFSPEAGADVLMEVTSLELTLDPAGNLQLRAGMTGQYLIADRVLLETAADIYSPQWEMTFQPRELDLPAFLEQRREMVRTEKMMDIQADAVVDALCLPDFPRHRQEGDTLTLELPGMVCLLYRMQDGQLRGTSQRWEERLSLKADRDSHLLAQPGEVQLQTREEPDGVMIKAEVPLQLQFSAETSINMVTEAEKGDRKVLPENRASLILCRAGEQSLWELARNNGSKVALIQEANGLAGEPEKDRMLLIPVV